MKNITVYSGPMCNFCDAAKRLLSRNNLNYNEIDISTKEGLKSEFILVFQLIVPLPESIEKNSFLLLDKNICPLFKTISEVSNKKESS